MVTALKNDTLVTNFTQCAKIFTLANYKICSDGPTLLTCNHIAAVVSQNFGNIISLNKFYSFQFLQYVQCKYIERKIYKYILKEKRLDHKFREYNNLTGREVSKVSILIYFLFRLIFFLLVNLCLLSEYLSIC
jgi:hypothetical protein